MNSNMQHLAAGTMLGHGKYRIVRFIGAGGFGCTYEAEFVPMRTRVAIKEFFVSTCCNRDATGAISLGASSQAGLVAKLEEKFVCEAQRLFKLKHPGIVSVTDILQENGTSYYVMDYISGHSLQGLIESRGPLPEARALRYIGQVMDALEYVHGKSMLHLDIKPDNIMIDAETDCAILIDFGVSKQYDEIDGHNTSTIMGQTPGYAPPEQAGNSLRQFTPAADIYALGATLYTALTAMVPPCSTDLISEAAELEPLPAGTTAATQKAIVAMMQPSLKRRIQTVAAARALLAAAPAPPPVETVSVGGTPTAPLVNPSGVETVPTPTPVSPTSGYEGQYQWLDMGTRVRWATCNVGASSPKDYGTYFAWGETSPAPGNDYSLSNCRLYGNGYISTLKGDDRYDAARANWGGKWRMPTKEDFEDLLRKCDCSWDSSRKGLVVKSKVNSNELFFPGAGWQSGSSTNYVGSYGDYWSATPDGSYGAWFLYFYSGGQLVISNGGRFSGFSVRPVLE